MNGVIMVELTSDVFVSLGDILYIRPADGGVGSWVQLRESRGFGDSREPREVIEYIARHLNA